MSERKRKLKQKPLKGNEDLKGKLNMEKTFVIFEHLLERTLRELRRIERKAKRYGNKFEITVASESTKEWVSTYIHDEVNHIDIAGPKYLIDAREITINYELVVMNGWTVVAMIEPMPNTNLRYVTLFSKKDNIKEEWVHSDMHCEHCNTNRNRNAVFIVRNTDGKEVQVGKTCLKDYTGIDPVGILWAAQLSDICLNEPEPYGEFIRNKVNHVWYDVKDVIAVAYELIKKYGYVKSSEKNSTKEELIKEIHTDNKELLTEEGKQIAEKICNWLKKADERKLSDFELTCKTFIESGYVKINHLGYIAYLPVAYNKDLEKRRKREEKAKQSPSQYVGQVNQRITVKIAESACLTSWETYYGWNKKTIFLYQIKDEEGNVFIWKTGNLLMVWDKDDEKPHEATVIKGTVKEHSEFNGVKQTVLTRCKVS